MEKKIPFAISPVRIEVIFERLPKGNAKLRYEEHFDENLKDIAERTVSAMKKTIPEANVRLEGNKIIIEETGERKFLAGIVISEFLVQAIENEGDVLFNIGKIISMFREGFVPPITESSDLEVKFPELPPELSQVTVRELLAEGERLATGFDRFHLENIKEMVDQGIISPEDTFQKALDKGMEYRKKIKECLR